MLYVKFGVHFVCVAN